MKQTGFGLVVLLVCLLAGVTSLSHPDGKTRLKPGTPAVKGQFLYQVSAFYGLLVREYGCGGALLSSRAAITSAQCCKKIADKYDSTICAGFLGEAELTGQVAYIQDMIIHPDYDHSTRTNDLCIIISTEDIDFSQGDVATIELGDSKSCNVGAECAVTGTYLNEKNFTSVNFANVTNLDTKMCKYTNFDANKNLCVGDTEAGVGLSDARDMGAPLQCNNHLCGIFSYSPKEEADPSSPGMYTRLEPYLDWIQENSIPRQPTTTEPTPGGANVRAKVTSMVVLVAVITAFTF